MVTCPTLDPLDPHRLSAQATLPECEYDISFITFIRSIGVLTRPLTQISRKSGQARSKSGQIAESRSTGSADQQDGGRWQEITSGVFEKGL